MLLEGFELELHEVGAAVLLAEDLPIRRHVLSPVAVVGVSNGWGGVGWGGVGWGGVGWGGVGWGGVGWGGVGWVGR